ncbi:heavy metal translocating P-type ATPase [Pseudoduganella aquatica]|uniref:heavy metal translocating P-type ATPase n=1 Tax=Pseudoduganella aquatica TaxID=2660641 RepID=UPI001E4CF0ED|nr:heavy metal translocating P-type ATPase [Pseudoduganella aquatica]
MNTSTKIRIDLPLVLPDVQGDHDHCIARLNAALLGRPGIEQVHIKSGEANTPVLCVHYQPETISLQRVRELVQAAGAELTAKYGHLSTRIERALHARSARALADRLRAVPGVHEAEVSPSGAVTVEYERALVSEEALRSVLSEPGAVPSAGASSGTNTAAPAQHIVVPNKAERHDDHDHAGHDHGERFPHPEGKEGDHEHAHGGIFGENSELIFASVAGALLAVGWLIGRYGSGPDWLPLGCYIAAYGFGGFYTTKEAVENILARRFEIDTLMLVAAVGAAALGQWAEGALLLFLFSLGHSLEHYAMGRARRAIEALAKLAPETANVRRDGQLVEVPVGELQPGDIVAVRPNERLPADGVVTVGTSSVNQAPVTGESVPIDKQPVPDPQAAIASFDRVPAEHRVFAGTINGGGAIDVMVARRAEQSTMARVVKMVTDAEAQRSPTQHFTDRFEKLFVPSVLGLVALLLFAWVVIDEPFVDSFYRAMAVLVAASPCALAISVPSAVLSGVARAARGGVLVKGGAPLENLGTLSSIAFDKTGTLTEGKPKLTDVVTATGASEPDLLAVALAVEEHSDHPLAAAVIAGAKERLGNQPKAVASHVKSITGRGVQAMVDGEQVHIAKPVYFTENANAALPKDVDDANRNLVEQGRTTMIVRKGAKFLGVIGVMDTPRPVAGEVMAALRGLGIERLIMISGDNQQVADAVAKSVGLTEAKGDLMPEQKVVAIKELRTKHGKVAMVGDGVNDAPAMANATVGIAMGAAGSDVALETADVALMADDLSQLPFAVGLSRSTSRVIKQNLWVSLGVVAVLIPATIMGLNIGTAVLFHEGSTLLVVVNALRLLAYNDKLGGKTTASDSAQVKS